MDDLYLNQLNSLSNSSMQRMIHEGALNFADATERQKFSLAFLQLDFYGKSEEEGIKNMESGSLQA